MNPGHPSPASRRPDGMLATLASFIAAAFLASCAPGANLPVASDYGNTQYRLGPVDQVRIITFGEDQLTGDFRVNEQGKIEVPLLGGVQAAGLTTEQLDDEIATDLKERKLLSNASVTSEVLAYRPIFVLGEVAKPGQYPYQPGMTMLTSVAVAGGFTYRAVKDYAGVVRTPPGRKPIQARVLPDSLIAPGDVIEVYQRHF